MVKWSRIFVRSIRGLPNFLAIPIMNPLTRVHDMLSYMYSYLYHYAVYSDKAMVFIQEQCLWLLLFGYYS